MAFSGRGQWNSCGGVDGPGEWPGKSSLLWAFPIAQTFASLRGSVYYQERVICELAEAENFWSWHQQDIVQLGSLAAPQPPHLMWTPASQVFPVPSKNILWPCRLAVFFFFNVILNLQKRETGECRLPIHVHLETHLQLQDTIHYCSDMRPAVINRQGSHVEHSRWRASARGGDECQLLFLSKVLLKDQYYFLFHWPNLKNNCERAA